jgi:phage terminase large subunit-like protein
MHDVMAGRIVAGSWVRLAVDRQFRESERAASDTAWPYVFSAEHAAEVCGFLERLPHVEGKWSTPTIQLEPWQVFVVSTLFGWRQRDDRTRRRFTSLYLEVARKAAKSTLAAGLGLYHLLHEHEPGASVICGATTGQQARIVFSIMQRMVRKAAWLRDAGLQVWANAITCEAIDGSARPVNSKSQTLDGLNPSCIVLDESHAQSFGLHDVLKSAQGARRNPLLLAPTTAGYDLLSVGYALRQTVQKVLQQVLTNDNLLGIIYALDEADDWRDEKTWAKANPSIGVTPTLEWVRGYARDAEQTPGLAGEFQVKVCSLWLHSASTWLSMPAWDRCTDTELTIASFAKGKCWIGSDLASRDDLAALAFLFERAGVLYGFTRCYLPELVVADRAREIPEYRVWADAGLLVLTDGDMIDLNRIERDIRDACTRYDVRDICFDTYGSLQISSSLAADGLPARVEGKSPKTFTGPSLELEARIRAGKFRHDGNSLLKWAASNAVVSRRTDGSLLPKKATAESAHKIDPIDALLMAIGGWLRQPAERQSVYETRGVLTV